MSKQTDGGGPSEGASGDSASGASSEKPHEAFIALKIQTSADKGKKFHEILKETVPKPKPNAKLPDRQFLIVTFCEDQIDQMTKGYACMYVCLRRGRGSKEVHSTSLTHSLTLSLSLSLSLSV